MTDISIELDTRQLQAWAAQTTKAIAKNLRSAVNTSARYARKQIIPVMAKDANVPAARFRSGTPLVKAAGIGGLQATWTVGKSANFVRTPGGATFTPVRNQGGTAATFTLTGGGSASLNLPKAFSLGGKGVFVRFGREKADIKGIMSEMPVTGMEQSDGAPRKAWTEAAETSISLLTVAAIQAALKGADAPATSSAFTVGADE